MDASHANHVLYNIAGKMYREFALAFVLMRVMDVLQLLLAHFSVSSKSLSCDRVRRWAISWTRIAWVHIKPL